MNIYARIATITATFAASGIVYSDDPNVSPASLPGVIIFEQESDVETSGQVIIKQKHHIEIQCLSDLQATNLATAQSAALALSDNVLACFKSLPVSWEFSKPRKYAKGFVGGHAVYGVIMPITIFDTND